MKKLKLKPIMLAIAFMISIITNISPVHSQNKKWDYYGKAIWLNDTLCVRKVRVGPENSGMYGVIKAYRHDGVVLIEPKYEYMSDFELNGLALVKQEGKCGYVNWRGQEITPIKYNQPRWNWSFINNRSLVRNGNKFGYINDKGDEVIPLKFAFANPFNEDFAVVYVGQTEIDDFDGRPKVWNDLKCGIIDTFGNYIIKPNIYKKIWKGNSNQIIAQKQNETIDFIDSKGKMINATDYSDIEPFADRFYIVYRLKESKYKEYGVIDNNMKIIIPLKYEYIKPFELSNRKIIFFARTNKDSFNHEIERGKDVPSRIFYLEEDGSLLTQKDYYIKRYNDGMLSQFDLMWSGNIQVVLDINNKYGYINSEGEEIISCQFSYAENFSKISGLAIVKDWSGKYGAIDRNGKLVIPLKYTYMVNRFRSDQKIQADIIDDSGKKRTIHLDDLGNEL